VTASPMKELYNSPNGDRWVLSRNPSGMLVVSHHPNTASGGRFSEIGVDVFLAQGAGTSGASRSARKFGCVRAVRSSLPDARRHASSRSRW
jgi:hypothetical protein